MVPSTTSEMHPSGPLVGNAHPTDCRLIIDPPLPGPWNMGVDEALLAEAFENGVATLRFYQWNEPTLSLGYFQRYADREQHAASRNCPVVRRQSGGGAILHDHELTYSLAVPSSFPLARQAGALYDYVHSAFIAALTGLPFSPSSSALRIRGDQTAPPAIHEPFLCFERQSPGDVILIPGGSAATAGYPTSTATPESGWKVLGSAQRRHRGAILQHGSLLAKKSVAAPELPGLSDLSNMELQIDELAAAVAAGFAAALNVRLVPDQLSKDVESKAADLANKKYSSAAWTKRR